MKGETVVSVFGAITMVALYFGWVHPPRAAQLLAQDASATAAMGENPGASEAVRVRATRHVERWRAARDRYARRLSVSSAQRTDEILAALAASGVDLRTLDSRADGPGSIAVEVEAPVDPLLEFWGSVARRGHFAVSHLEVVAADDRFRAKMALDVPSGDSPMIWDPAWSASCAGETPKRLASTSQVDDLSELRLVGVIEHEDGDVALIESHNGVGYVVRAGSWLPEWNTLVEAVGKDGVHVRREGRATRVTL